MAHNAHLSTPDPEYAELYAKIPRTTAPKDVELIRHAVNTQAIGAIQEHFRPNLPQDTQYRVVDHAVLHDDGASTLVRTLTPTQSTNDDANLPCLIWIHGGGFIAGSIGLDDFRMRIACVELQIVIVLVEYRLAPEHRFPMPLDDCYGSLKWIAENAGLFGASLSKGFLIGGESAGAHIAAAITHRARDDPFFDGRRLTGQVLQIPAVINPAAYSEEYKGELLSINMQENKDMSILTSELIYDMYEKLGGISTDPGVSPLLYPSHEGLPPMFIQIAGLDPLRDEGILYEKVLREAGVKTRLCTYPGVPHGFNIFFPRLKASRLFEDNLTEGLKWLLNGAS